AVRHRPVSLGDGRDGGGHRGIGRGGARPVRASAVECRRMAPSDDIDRLILELHASAGAPSPAGDVTRIERWLRLLASRNGSDLLLVAGAPPSIRVDGRVLPLAEGPLDGADVEEAVLPALPPHARRIYRDTHIVDASF